MWVSFTLLFRFVYPTTNERALRRAKGNVALVDLIHGYFVIRFHQEEDMRDEGLDRSTMENKQPQYPVLILKGGHRRPETAVLHKAPASIIFPGLNYFEKRRPDIIDSLASRMGSPIQLDEHTAKLKKRSIPLTWVAI